MYYTLCILHSNNLCKDVSQGTVGQTVLALVLTLLMVTDVKEPVTVTRLAVMCLQDARLQPQVHIIFLKLFCFEKFTLQHLDLII